eukprot:gene20331-27091_t
MPATGQPPPTPSTLTASFTAIDPSAFKGGFSEAQLIAFLAKDVIHRGGGSSSNEGAGAPHLKATSSLAKVGTLISTLDRAELELQSLQHDVTKKVSSLNLLVSKQAAGYKDSLAGYDTGAKAVREAFRVLGDRMNKVSQVGTRIGDRLQTADNIRTKATQLVELVEYLKLFSNLGREADENNWKAGGLPPTFWDDQHIAEAAAYTQKLTAMAMQAKVAKQRNRLVVDVDSREDDARTKGSLENTLLRLEQYAHWLEMRVMARFDRALATDNRAMMAECGKVMAEFGREKALIQRFVSTQPMFMVSQ